MSDAWNGNVEASQRALDESGVSTGTPTAAQRLVAAIIRRLAEAKIGYAPGTAVFGDVLSVDPVSCSGVCHATGPAYWAFDGRLEAGHHRYRLVGELSEEDSEGVVLWTQRYERWVDFC